MRALRLLPAGALLAVACGGRPPAMFLGESTHFRLYVDPALMPLPEQYATDNALAALETEWADVATMLKMPDAKIDYYWYAQEHVGAACDDVQEGGCTKEDAMEIDAAMLPDAHELNHAYTFLRSPRRPIPFLAEGIAEAIGCGYEAPYPVTLGQNWRGAVAAVRSAEVYGQGGLFVRQMIRRHGIDEFMRYYEQSPERRDPALFAANFDSFWGEPIDDVWAELNDFDRAPPFVDQKICPCSLPAIPTGDSLASDPARVPYWTVPDLGDATIALTANRYQQVSVRSCAGDAMPLTGKGVLARLGSGGGWYVMAPLAAVGVDQYLADDCAGAAHYTLSPDVLVGNPYLTVSLPAAAVQTVYLAIDVPFPLDAHVQGLRAICDSCSFDPASCPALLDSNSTPITGSFYTWMKFFATATEQQFAQLDTQSLRFFR